MDILDDGHSPSTLMESGILPIADPMVTGVRLQRGMLVLDQDELVVGHVAALVVTHNAHVTTHFLLHEEHQSHYRRCPVELIKAVVAGRIQLRIVREKVQNLPLWHSNE